MTAPYSIDLRERALARKARGETNREIAAALSISPSCVSKMDEAQAGNRLVGPGSGRRLQATDAGGRLP
jgi:putative transposase